jgi:hypothetical protein
MFEKSRHLLCDGVMRGPNTPLVWCLPSFFFFSLLSSSNLVLAPSQFQTSSINFLFLHIWSMSFWLLFFLISYKNYKYFSISLYFFNLSDLVLILPITIFLKSYKITNCFQFYPPFIFFNLSNLILILLITIYFV